MIHLEDPEIIPVSTDLYYSKNLNKSMDYCKLLSENDGELWSVVYGMSKTLERMVFFIERGLPLIRTGEMLVCEYEKGVKIR